MPLSQHIAAVVKQLDEKPSFAFATANELDAELNKLTQFPVVGMVPETSVQLGYGLSNAIPDKYPVFIYFVYKAQANQATAAHREVLVKQALELCKEFLVKLANYRFEEGGRVFRIKSKQKVEFKTIYQAFSSITAGGYITMTLETMYSDNVQLKRE